MVDINPRELDLDAVTVGGHQLDSWEGEDEAVDHAQSAKNNLKAIGDDFKAMVSADKLAMSASMLRAEHTGGTVLFGLEMLMGALSLPWTAVADVADLVVQPAFAAKELVDAAIHGVLAGVQKLRD